MPKLLVLLGVGLFAAALFFEAPKSWARSGFGSPPWLPLTTRDTSTITPRPGQVVSADDHD
jgi:hypothetical protein